MILRTVAAALAALALAGGGGERPDWGDATEEWTRGGDYERSKAICRSLKRREPPAADRPSPAAAAALQGCDSEALYYGIGMKADPVRARHCAFLEADAADAGGGEGVFAGRTMLMTIYANGVGARRDLDVATHLACGIDGAPAESHGRVLHLQEAKASGWKGTDFHFCDDTTSGLAAGYCAGHAARIAGAKREAEIAALAARWSAAEKAAFARLRAAQQAYGEAHADGEVDMSGTLRGAFWTHAAEGRADDFLALLRLLAAGRVPSATAAEHRRADAALNAAYRTRLAALGGEDHGTVTRDGVRGAQRAWLRYRDAMLGFAARKFPAASRDGIAVRLIGERTAILRGEDEG